MEIRPYQREAIDAVLGEFERGVRSTMIVMPTGTGKSFTFAQVAKAMVGRGSVLVLAHRRELVQQAARTMRQAAGLECEVEMAEHRAGSLFLPEVVAASVDTLRQPKRLAQYHPEGVGLVIADECHHATASTWRRIFDHFSQAKILGVTATADRADGVGLGNVFETCAYVYEIRDAIEQGYLVPIRQKSVQVAGLDLSTLKVTRKGDFKDEDVEAMMRQEEVLHEVASPMVELAEGRPTVVFAAGVNHAHELARVLRGYGVTAAAIDASTPTDDRERILRELYEGRLQFLANVGVLTEGWDCPPVSCIAMARPTQSRALYSQCAGRGLRLHPESGKRDCIILDFAGNAGKHALVSALDILDGRDLPEDVKRKAKEMADAGSDLPVHELLDAAHAELDREERARLAVKARYRTVEVDPFRLLQADRRKGRWGGVPATEKQLELLAKHGMKFKPEDIDKGQASALITKIFQRREKKLSTFKQARILAKRGLNPDVSFEDAKMALDAIQANDWRTPEWLFDDPRFRISSDEEAA